MALPRTTNCYLPLGSLLAYLGALLAREESLFQRMSTRHFYTDLLGGFVIALILWEIVRQVIRWLFGGIIGAQVLAIIADIFSYERRGVAMTNYILQTLLYLLFFFHWPGMLKLYGKISFAETFIVGFLFFTGQVFFSRWWMKNHEQGPVEGAWKKFSYRFFSKSVHPQKKFTSHQTVKS